MGNLADDGVRGTHGAAREGSNTIAGALRPLVILEKRSNPATGGLVGKRTIEILQ